MSEAASQAADDFIETVRQHEREAIIKWLVLGSNDIELVASMAGQWRAIWWAICHPVRFAVASALAEAGTAIFRGEHLTPTRQTERR